MFRVEYGPRGARRTERVKGTKRDGHRHVGPSTGRGRGDRVGRRRAAGRPPGVVTVGTWMDHWAVHVVGARKGRHGDGLSASSKRREAWAIGEIKKALGDRSLRTLTSEDVETFLGQRAVGIGCERRPWTQDSCKDVKNLLARALDAAINRGHTSAPNKARDAGIPGTAALPEKRDALDKADARALYRAARADGSPASLVLALQLTTGLRPGEAFGLQWGRVDMDEHTLRIARAKTPTGRRTLHLSDAAMAVLVEARRAAELRSRDPEAFVFPGIRSPHVTEYALIAKLEALCTAEAITIPTRRVAAVTASPRITPHVRLSHAGRRRLATTGRRNHGRQTRNGPPDLRPRHRICPR